MEIKAIFKKFSEHSNIIHRVKLMLVETFTSNATLPCI